MNFEHPSVQLCSFQIGDGRNWTEKEKKKEKSLRRKVFGLKRRRIGGVKVLHEGDNENGEGKYLKIE